MKSTDSAKRKPWYRQHLSVLIGVVLCVASVGVVILVRAAIQNSEPPRRMTQVTLLNIPPPPPPPAVEQPPPPEVKEKVEIPQMQQPDDAQASSNELGVDANASGGDGFGLKAKKGARGLLDGGPFGWYSSLLKADIRDFIAEERKLRRRYTVVFDLWIAKDGRIQRVELASGTGNQDLDKALKVAIAEMGKVREPPPNEMPQPVRLRVTSRI